MKYFFAVSAIIISLSCHTIEISSYMISQKDLYEIKKAFSDFKKITQKDDGKLWNYNLAGPILLINENSKLVIANEPDEAGALIEQDGIFLGELPKNLNPANTAAYWNGKRWTMALLPLPDSIEERMELLIHESFHRIQPFIGFDSLYDIQCNHLETKEGRIFLKLEMEALRKALDSSNPIIHLHNALLFRKYRYQLFPNAKQAENSLEINEGLAEYTGAILSGRTEIDLHKHFISQISLLYEKQSFTRLFAYNTIPVYGYFMNKSDKKWNLKINKHTNLTDFITDFYQFHITKIDTGLLSKISNDYNIQAIQEYECNREALYLEKINYYKHFFFNESMLSIRLKNMNISFSPSNIFQIDTLGTLYPNLRIIDYWGILEVDSIGALISPKWDKVIISGPKAITDTLIQGVGWRIFPKPGWHIKRKDYGFVLEKEN
ncbi:MAG: hypothetical protein RDU14_07775 [Melioribacteraceae bacterium]|nr:hypothetical protein [Melioribacteraceae bacterium]